MSGKVGLLMVGLLLCGCTPQGSGLPPTVPVPLVSASGQPDDSNTWVMPAIISIGNYAPGDVAMYPIEIHNGKTETVTYHVAYRVPDRTYEGFTPAGAGHARYVAVEPEWLTLGPRETGSATVVMSMGAQDAPPAAAWEFWVSVVDTAGTGLIQHELCSRWTVTMKE